MSYPTIIDYDKLIKMVLLELHDAINQWIKGEPKAEIALLNLITAKLKKNRRNCNVGTYHPLHVKTEFHLLHRKGDNHTDLFGSDFAVTFTFTPINVRKTVFIQLKKSTDFEVVLEHRQLNEAMQNPYTANRSFILVVDDNNLGIRIKQISELKNELSDIQKTTKIDVGDWNFLSRWLWDWISCESGEKSIFDDPESVENYLRNIFELGNRGIHEIDRYPTREWLEVIFTKDSKSHNSNYSLL